MAWVTPPDFNSGDVLAASDLDILGVDLLYLKGIADGVEFSGVQLRRAATQNIADSNDEYVSWDTQNWDFGSWWSSGTGIDVPSGAIPSGFTEIAIGVVVAVKWASDATGKRRVSLQKNGSEFGRWKLQAIDDDNMDLNLFEITTAEAGDTIKAEVWQNSGGSLHVQEARITVWRIAPTQ